MAGTFTKDENMKQTSQKYLIRNIPRKHFLFVLLISFFGAALYFQTSNYKFTADDGIYTYNNKATQQGILRTGDLFKYGSMSFLNIEPTNSGTYRPLTLITFALERQIVGEFNPAYGHIINIILYFILLIVIGILLVQLFSLKNIPVVVPILILLLYAVHPLHIEVIASIKSRDTLLSALFSLFAVYVWLQNNQKSNIRISIIVGILFLMALLSKEESLTMIAVVFLISWFFLYENFTKSLKNTIPLLMAGIIYLIIRQIVLDPPSSTYNNILNNVIFATQPQERFPTNLYIWLYYIKLLIFPHPLSWDYSYSQITIKTMSDVWVISSFIFFSGLVYIAIKGFRKRTITGFVILFYISTFSIFSNFTPAITIGSTIAERFMFIPSLSLCIILVYGLYTLLKTLKSVKLIPVLILITLLLVIIYTAKSFTRIPVWKDGFTLCYSGIIDSPKSWRTHILYADELRLQAVKLSKDTIHSKINKDTIQGMFQNAVYHYNKGYSILGDKVKLSTYLQGLGECYLYLKDTLSAKATFIKAIENPKSFFGFFKLGMISFNEKKYNDAVHYYQKALNSNSPDFFSTYKNLAGSYMMLRDYKKSIEAYEEALKYGTSQEIVSNLSFLYASLGDYDKANSLLPINKISEVEKHFLSMMNAGKETYDRGNYREAIKCFKQCESGYHKYGGYAKFPDYLNAWARSHLNLNEISQAKAIFNQVIQGDPKNFYAMMNLGNIAFNNEKNYTQAIAYFSKCIKANTPDYFLSYSNLGTLYLVQNQPDKAIENYEMALKYGSSQTVLGNLYLLWKSKGNQDKMTYYKLLMDKK